VTEAAREIGNALDLAYNKEAAISAIIRRTVQEPMGRELAHERADRMDAEKWNQTHIDECQNLRTQLATLGITRPKE
jgi:Arc/MetJ family transcription regulator